MIKKDQLDLLTTNVLSILFVECSNYVVPSFEQPIGSIVYIYLNYVWTNQKGGFINNKLATQWVEICRLYSLYYITLHSQFGEACLAVQFFVTLIV